MLTDLSFLNPKQVWPPASEADRIKEYAEFKALFDGKHGELYKDWFRLMRDDVKTAFLLLLNWNKRLSTLWADLLLGEPPKFRAGDPETAEQMALDAIIKRNRLPLRAYEVAIDVSRYGTGIFRLRNSRGKVKIESQPPHVWFPVVSPDNIKETTHHVLGWVFESASPTFFNSEAVKHYLKVEIHELGKVTHKLFLVNKFQDGYTIKQEVALNTLPAYAGVDPVEEYPELEDQFLIFPVARLSTSDTPEGVAPSDYPEVQAIITELMTRFSQIARILDKHSDPHMSGPDIAVEEEEDEEGNSKVVVKGGSKYFPVAPGDVEPKYITWDGQLEAAYKEIEELMKQLYILSETSPAAFGQLESGLAESGSALRRLMMTPLAKVNRIRLNFDPALKDLLMAASKLEKSLSIKGSVELEDVEIHWKDGLPEDQNEQVTIESTSLTAGLSSKESSVRRLWGLEGQALKDELARIEADAKKAQELIAPPDEEGPEDNKKDEE